MITIRPEVLTRLRSLRDYSIAVESAMGNWPMGNSDKKNKFQRGVKVHQISPGGAIVKKGNNPNHPKKGDRIKVDPIRRKEDIDSIKNLVKDSPRDLALFILGINTNLRASDLLRIKVGQVRDLKAGEEIEFKEKKTGKPRRITLNSSGVQAIQKLLASKSYVDENPLFLGQRGVLTVSSVHRLVKGWCKTIGLKGNFGSHTLRKTWGYHQRVTFGVDIPRLMVCFNHSNQRQTLDYLCVQPEEIKDVYANEL